MESRILSIFLEKFPSSAFLGKLYEIILIIAVVLLLFGGRKIPELMRGLGSGIKEFKNATKEEENPKVEKKEDN